MQADSPLNEDLTLTNQITGQVYDSSNTTIDATYDPATEQVDFTFPSFPNGMLPDGNYTATLFSGAVLDDNGAGLGDDYTLAFWTYQGDANHDRSINASDFDALASNYGSHGRGFSDGDFNYDGVVDSADFNILASRFNTDFSGPAAPDFLFAPGGALAAPTGQSAPAAAPLGTLFSARIHRFGPQFGRSGRPRVGQTLAASQLLKNICRKPDFRLQPIAGRSMVILPPRSHPLHEPQRGGMRSFGAALLRKRLHVILGFDPHFSSGVGVSFMKRQSLSPSCGLPMFENLENRQFFNITTTVVPVPISAAALSADPTLANYNTFDIQVTLAKGERWESCDMDAQLTSGTFYNVPTSAHGSDHVQSNLWSLIPQLTADTAVSASNFSAPDHPGLIPASDHQRDIHQHGNQRHLGHARRSGHGHIHRRPPDREQDRQRRY